MTREGMIANLGAPEQVVFDFGKVVRHLALIDVDHPLICDLDTWRDILIDTIADVPTQVQLEDAPGIVTTMLAFIAAMNRPMLMGRFRVYAGPVLTPQELSRYVLHPQISYDFGQLEQLVDDCDDEAHRIISEIQLYKILCWEEKVLPSGEGVLSSVFDLVCGIDRPLLQERLHSYLRSILPVVEDDDYAVAVVRQRAFISCLLPTLLDPPIV